MADSNNSNTRPAQILLTEADREAVSDLQRRVGKHGARVSGPTPIFRAGLQLLRTLPDEEMAAIFAALDERPTPAMLEETFMQWCSDVNDRVCGLDIGLQYAWDGRNASGNVGHFSEQTRWVLLLLGNDGRVLISGMRSDRDSQGDRNLQQLFPSRGLATHLSMNEEGAAIAARAIAAWLMPENKDTVEGKPAAIEATREEVRQHQAVPLR